MNTGYKPNEYTGDRPGRFVFVFSFFSISLPLASKPLTISIDKNHNGDVLSLISRTGTLLLAISILAGLAIAAEEDKGYTINLGTNENLGSYLVNETGFSLYYFINDPGNGTSTCFGDCIKSWPAFHAEKIIVPESLNASDFTEVIRTDGINQTAYKGWPLYFYYEDTAPGDVKGHGVNDLWFVVSPEDFIIIEA